MKWRGPSKNERACQNALDRIVPLIRKFQTMTKQVIAVVDDDPGLRTLLKTFLEKEGYGVLAIEGAGETRALAETSTINAFLVDIRLRGEDGLSLCRYIRNLPAHVHTPILCITAQEDSDVVQEAFKAEIGRAHV